MEASRKYQILLATFALSLFALYINDFYLKQVFHNGFTGKLSDFAGLLIFPWFWSLVFKKSAKWVYLGTSLLFVFWKLEWSSSFIQFLNESFGASFSRVVDKTDLIALTILPISFTLFIASKNQISQLGSYIKYPIAAFSIFAFLATSQPKISVEPNWEFSQNYSLPYSKDELLTTQMNYRNTDTSDSTLLTQSNFRINYFGGIYDFTFNASINEVDSLRTNLTLTRLIAYAIIGVQNKRKNSLDKTEFLEIFENEVIPALESPTEYPLFSYSEVEE